MKISGTSRRSGVSRSRNSKVDKASDFSSLLNSANKEQVEIRIDKMLDDIDKIGRKLISTRSVEDAKDYKDAIKEYLDLIVKNIYVLKKETGPYSYGVTIRIEVINKKLDELTKKLIADQQESIELANTISEIRGLLVDVYK